MSKRTGSTEKAKAKAPHATAAPDVGKPGGFLDRRFVVIAGKGGVGRTVVAASLALTAARRGKRVLLAQTRAKDPAHLLLGGPPVGDAVVATRENLWCVNMTPQAALHEYGVMVLKFESVYRKVFENRLVRSFLRAVPGLDDYAMLGKAWFHTTEVVRGRPRYDVVVIDGPATGHLLPMLRLPRVILDSVPEGPLTRDAARIWQLLSSPAHTVVHLVTLAEEMPVSETIELAGELRTLRLALGLLIVNAIVHDYAPAESDAARVLDALGPDPTDAALRDSVVPARLLRRRRRMQDRYLERVRNALNLPTATLPELMTAQIGPPEIERLSDLLAPFV